MPQGLHVSNGRCPSVCLNSLQRVCCCGPVGHEISINCCMAGVLQQRRRSSTAHAARHSTANANSVTSIDFYSLCVCAGALGVVEMNAEDKLSETAATAGCRRLLSAAVRRCRLVRARCVTSSCVSICSKTFLVIVNFVFLVSHSTSSLTSIDGRGRSDRVTIVANHNANLYLMTFDFLSPVVTSTRPKSQDQKPVGSKARVETNGRTDGDGHDRLQYRAR